MRKWRQSRLTGWGFSDVYLENQDMHVGNQTILLHSGIVGAVLMALFFIYFNGKMLMGALAMGEDTPARRVLFVFPIFFLGWFLIHSSTQFYFSYHVLPNIGMIQALFFCLGGLLYHQEVEEALDTRSADAILKGYEF